LFYTIDVVERFHAAQQLGGSVDPLRFVAFQALGRAIIYANPPSELSERLPLPERHPGEPRRSVVLVDEIDKAPIDVPNDLLMELENMRFYMPELNRTISAPKEMRPIVIITSNSERVLPDAFLRRCVYYDMSFPDHTTLAQIVCSRLKSMPQTSPLVADSLDVLEKVRKRVSGKKPGTAELLDFLLSLRGKRFQPSDSLHSRNDWLVEARSTLLKSTDDQSRILKEISGGLWEIG
jgi:MoxR-like ATPase